MHAIVTGAIGIGKSTAVRRAVALLGLHTGGYETFFVGDRTVLPKTLCMARYGERSQRENRQIAAQFESQGRHVHSDVFEQFGTDLLSQARFSAELIIMDECGRLEADAKRFQQAVLQTLAGDTPVICVIRMDAGGWIDSIRAMNGTQLLVVTEDNRDSMPERIAQVIRSGEIKEGAY